MNHSIEIPILQQWLPSTTMATQHRLSKELATIKQILEKNKLHTFEWIPAKQQLADCLTKLGTSSLNLARAMENGRISQ